MLVANNPQTSSADTATVLRNGEPILRHYAREANTAGGGDARLARLFRNQADLDGQLVLQQQLVIVCGVAA